VNIVFLSTFAVGSGLAGLGGALGAEMLGSIRPSRSSS
jgi:branched-chain amino acid transport system permease protein